MAKGLLSDPKQGGGKKKGKGKGEAQGYMRYVPKNQRQVIDQRTQMDMGLGNAANQLLPGVADAYSQPFDWSGLPSAPVSGDFSKWREDQLQSGLSEWDRLNAARVQEQRDDFEQQMANRGIPMGSELYNKQKTAMEQSFSSERNQAFENIKASAGQNAGQFFDIGTSARGNALNEGMMQRNQPLNEYSALLGAQSPYALANLDYGQKRAMQEDDQSNQRWLMKNTPRGGGGGGGAGAAWQQYGFSTPQEYADYQRQREREDMQFLWENSPQYKQPSQPNPWASAAGNLGGAFLSGYAQSAGKSGSGIFSSIKNLFS